MVDAAQADDIDLRQEDCYRTYKEQAMAYDRRCPYVETPIFGVDVVTGQQVQTGTHRARECTGPPIAPAGASNHGWGRAVDFATRDRVLSCYDDEFHWMKNNAESPTPPWSNTSRSTPDSSPPSSNGPLLSPNLSL
jgi:LAS superfamily LD-carboxypeptidase LdcB